MDGAETTNGTERGCFGLLPFMWISKDVNTTNLWNRVP